MVPGYGFEHVIVAFPDTTLTPVTHCEKGYPEKVSTGGVWSPGRMKMSCAGARTSKRPVKVVPGPIMITLSARKTYE